MNNTWPIALGLLGLMAGALLGITINVQHMTKALDVIAMSCGPSR